MTNFSRRVAGGRGVWGLRDSGLRFGFGFWFRSFSDSNPRNLVSTPTGGASEYAMPIDALVIGAVTLIAAVSHFIWWDTQESKKPADGCNRQQATRNTPTQR